MSSRNWSFTLNNYTDAEVEALSKVPFKYIVFGREIGASGTPHLQGTVVFTSQRLIGGVRKLIPRAHVEKTIDLYASIEYCKKDGDFTEYGDAPKLKSDQGPKGKEYWSTVIKYAELGQFKELEEFAPYFWLSNRQKCMEMYKRPKTILDGELTHEWWWGRPGTGKSKTFHEQYPTFYRKLKNKWWDNYVDEDVVLIEEWSPDYKCLTEHLKEWADRYPFSGEIKGGTVQNLRPKKVIVLSNFSIEACFDGIQVEAINRRFKSVHFGPPECAYAPNFIPGN